MTLPPLPSPFGVGDFTFTQGDAEWHRLRKLALTDLFWFNSVVLGYGPLVPLTEATHRALCRVAEGRTGHSAIDDAHVQRLELPRDWGKCQAAESLVLCADGTYKRADALRVGDKVLSMTEAYKLVWRPIIGIDVNGEREVHTLHTRTGRTLTVTGNHPIRQLRTWTPAGELRPGDRVALSRHTPEPKHATACVAEAAFLGYMLGDGSCPSALFTNADEAVLTDFEACVTALGGTSWRRASKKSKATDVLTQGLRNVLRKHDSLKSRSGTKRVSAHLFRSDNASVAALLRALFTCDGTVEKDRGAVSYSSVSFGLCQDIQRLLLRFGIVAALQKKNGRYKGERHESWRLRIGGVDASRVYAEKIGFVGIKQTRLLTMLASREASENGVDTVPAEWRSLLPKREVGKQDGNGLRGAHGIRVDNKNSTSWRKAKAACAVYDIPDIAAMQSSIFWDKIERIETSRAPTYSIEVADTHVYCVEDIVTHNTTTITQGLAIQLICGDPNISILICNEKEQNAKDYLGAIKWQFEANNFLRALFPEVIPADLNNTTWSASRIVVRRTTGRKEPTVFVIGVGGTVTGSHPDVVIVDDMLSREAMENARAGSWQIMHQTNRWINQLRPLLSKQYAKWRIYFIGTRWWHGDSYDHIDLAYGYNEDPVTFTLRLPLPNGEVQVLSATRRGDLVTFKRAAIENGRSSFPEKWSLEDLAKMRLVDEALFACNMMNNPSDEHTATFKASWLKYYDWASERQFTYVDGVGKKSIMDLGDLDVLIFVDPGGFAKRTVEDRARPAVVVVGDDRKGNYFILDIYNEKDTFLAAIAQIVAWCTKYAPRKVYTERAGQQEAFAALLRVELAKAGLTTVVDSTTLKPGATQKEVRILALEPYFQRGQVYVGKGAAFHTFREQYTQFPRTARFDVLDVLAYLPRVVKPRAQANQTRNAAARQEAELTAYRARRGLG